MLMRNTIALLGYSIVEKLYAGSRTLVYRATREVDHQPVVIKLLKNEHPSFSELVQFRNQYTIAINLDIPGIIKPYSLEPYGNSYALVMEDFGGCSLRHFADGQALPLEQFMAIALQLVDILCALHQQRIIHKDIKPANILIQPKTQQVKLIDFSISSLLCRETQDIKPPHGLEGTLAYLSPEQTGRMNRGIDYRSDFYSLGVTFYELLTGQLPFQSHDPMEIVHCHIAEQPPSICTLNPKIPPMLGEIIDKLMAKNAEERYQSALGLNHDLICLAQSQTIGSLDKFELGQRDLCDRFLIPEKLYGRETEVQTLLEAFDRTANGTSELILVAGFSGIGKTAVVNEVHKPIVRQRGYFIKGKFDQFNRNIPFSAFVQAFRDLMEQLLSESDTQLHNWQAQMLSALGDSGQVIVDVIPELGQIIGVQPSVPELSGTAAQNRFNLLFQKFIQVFTTPEHPLVMFLDDLQWADSASLNLMQLLMNESESGYLLLIGAYRDNEVSPAHPLMLTLGSVNKEAIVNTIKLQPLNQNSLNRLVSDTLNCRLEFAVPLSDLVYQKTKGNPFFATQFLKVLHQEELIAFDRHAGLWQCDIVRVREAALTDDVVEFMATQLKKLPEATQNILKLAACIGNQFDLYTLAIVSEQLETDVATTLWKALQEGLILPQSEIYKFYLGTDETTQITKQESLNHESLNYRFLHDRVQQAAYSLIPDNQKQITHLQIGRLLQQAAANSEPDQSIFAIVNHLNKSATLIEDEQEQQELAQLNLAAGQKAKSATAYAAALDYFNTGIALLREDAWQRQYDLSLALYEGATHSAYLSTEFEQMEQLAAVVLKQASSWLDRVNTSNARIQACVAQNQPLKALCIAREVLEHLGVSLPEQPTPAQVDQSLQHTQTLLENRAIESLLELPKMTAPEQQAAMVILSSITSAAYQSAPKLLPLAICAQINLSIQYGNAPESTYGYVMYGLMQIVALRDIEAGYRFGQLGIKLLDRLHTSNLTAKTIFGFNAHLSHWQEPAKDTLNGYLQAYSSGLETGDLEYVALSLTCYSYTAYFSGQELSALKQTMEDYRKLIQQFRQDARIHIQSIYYQSVLNLLEVRTEPDRLSSEHYDEDAMIQLHLEANQLLILFQIYFSKLVLAYLFERYEQALENARLSEQYLGSAAGLMHIPLFSFYDALTQLAVYSTANKTDQVTILDRVAAHQEKLRQWAVHAPSNQLHRCDLVAAERCRVLGQRAEAIDLYDSAIVRAREHEYIQEEAIANELSAKFYLEWGKERIAQEYLINAYYGYARWGAKAKIVALERHYPKLLAPILQHNHSPFSVNETVISSATDTSTTFGSVSDALDLAAILKASQTLSSEIELGKLLSTLLQLIIANAGADKCVLMLMRDDHLVVKGLATFGAPPVVLQRIPIEESQDIPLKLVYGVKNRLEAIVLIDATAHSDFSGDPYLLRQRPKSILCSPIFHQGKLLGVVYLENKLTIGAFTRDRVHILNLLCAQATISLENARLYQQAQESLEEARLMKFSIDQVTTPVCWTEPDARISYANDAFCRDVGYSPEEILNKYVYDLNPDFSKEGWSEHWQSIYQQGSTTFESRMRNSKGICYPVEVTVNHITFHEKEYHLTFVVNISDRKRAELAILQKSQELEQALLNLQHAQIQVVQSEKMSALGNLVAGVAHEINNPLGFISGNLQPALDHITDTFKLIDLYQQEYPHPSAVIREEIEEIDLNYVRQDLLKLISSMKLGVERIRGISTSLRIFSRADQDDKVGFNIHEGIDSTILILKHRLKANSDRPAIEINADYGDIPMIECFPGQLNQVFMNILANAIDTLEELSQKRTLKENISTPARIEIISRLDTSKKQVHVHVRDNGIGMPDEVKQRVFDHSFTTKAVGKGTGLGLAIVRQIIVEKHSGAIEVNSTLGVGTEFMITLPVTSPHHF
jgi:PAS domain S-box-containing protein